MWHFFDTTVWHTLRTVSSKRSATFFCHKMLHVCSSFLKRDALRTARLRVVPRFPWTVRQQGIVFRGAVTASQNETKPVAVSNGMSLLSKAEQGRQYTKTADLHHLRHHDSPEDRMTRLMPSKTGLPMHINISSVQPLLPPCIYVSKMTKPELPDLKEMFCATVPADPYYEPIVHGDTGDLTASDLQKVYKFIILNRQTLLVFWYQLDGCETYMKDLKSI